MQMSDLYNYWSHRLVRWLVRCFLLPYQVYKWNASIVWVHNILTLCRMESFKFAVKVWHKTILLRQTMMQSLWLSTILKIQIEKLFHVTRHPVSINKENQDQWKMLKMLLIYVLIWKYSKPSCEKTICMKRQEQIMISDKEISLNLNSLEVSGWRRVG